jgi:hypothetical protein
MSKHRKPKNRSTAKPAPISIHPRRPRLTDIGVSVPKDKDGTYRAANRLDGLVIDTRRVRRTA